MPLPFEFEIDEGVLRQLNSDHIPQAVKNAVADKLEEIANNPLMGVVQDPVAGPCHIFEFEHNDFLWRFGFNIVMDEDGPIGIGSVAINPP